MSDRLCINFDYWIYSIGFIPSLTALLHNSRFQSSLYVSILVAGSYERLDTKKVQDPLVRLPSWRYLFKSAAPYFWYASCHLYKLGDEGFASAANDKDKVNHHSSLSIQESTRAIASVRYTHHACHDTIPAASRVRQYNLLLHRPSMSRCYRLNHPCKQYHYNHSLRIT
jgi:hypothetical protein